MYVFLGKMALVIISSWTCDQVAEWLRGLDDVLSPYVHHFLNHKINGRKLLSFTRYDLEIMGIDKVGHQELLLEAIELLTSLHFGLEAENVQFICVQLECRARSLMNVMKRRQLNETEPPGDLSTDILADICYSLSAAKNLITWLDRAPFDASEEYVNNRNVIVKLGMEMTSTAQRDKVSREDEETIMKVCEKLCELCQRLVQECSDPLFIQPASLELATVKKKPDEELGMHIQSSYCGTHVIGGVKGQSPADICGKVEEGDEVIQVNSQTVVGWQLKKLVNVLKANPKEVILMLKKRPRHINFNAHLNKRKAAANKNKQGTFPRSQRRRSQDVVSTETTNRVPISEIITPPSALFSEREVFSLSSPRDNDEGDDVFRSGSESPSINVDYDKHRRATVSGASPTTTRSSILMHDLWEERPKSHIIYSPEPLRPYVEDLKADTFAFGNAKSSSLSGDASVRESLSQPHSVEFSSRTSTLSSENERCLPDQEKHQPTLLKITKKESIKVSDMPKKQTLNVQNTHPPNGRLRVTDPHDSPRMRRIKKPKDSKSSRRISCLDLGPGLCEGWLWKKKKGKFNKLMDVWEKLWCKLVDGKVYMYKDQKDLVAKCTFEVKMFKIGPYPERKFGFKATTGREETCIYLAGETDSDRDKWMNKLGLAAINYQGDQALAAFHKPEHVHISEGSEDEETYVKSQKPNSDGSLPLSPEELKKQRKDATLRPKKKLRFNHENVEQLFKSFHENKMSIIGDNISQRRKTVLSVYSSESSKKKELSLKLQSLQRTLKAKEEELKDIEDALKKLTPEKLHQFKEKHSQTLRSMQAEKGANLQPVDEQSSSGEDDTESVSDSLDSLNISEPGRYANAEDTHL